MDADFQYFYEKEGFGPADHTQLVPAEKIHRFRGKLPDQLLKYWEMYGWSGYGSGRLWVVDPDVYEPVMRAWLANTPFLEQDLFYVIARGAFGRLFLWGTRSGPSIEINSPWGTIFPRDNSVAIRAGRADTILRYFFSKFTKERLDQQDSLRRPLFERAVKALGPLLPNEMYGFEPALVLGGKADLKNLNRVDAVQHLTILAQLGDRKIMRDIAADARNAGLV